SQPLETNEARRIPDLEPSAQLPGPPPAAVPPQRASRVRSHSQLQSASESPAQGIDARTISDNSAAVPTQGTPQKRAKTRQTRAPARSLNADQQRAPQNNVGPQNN